MMMGWARDYAMMYAPPVVVLVPTARQVITTSTTRLIIVVGSKHMTLFIITTVPNSRAAEINRSESSNPWAVDAGCLF
jgi:hypothetical protein